MTKEEKIEMIRDELINRTGDIIDELMSDNNIDDDDDSEIYDELCGLMYDIIK